MTDTPEVEVTELATGLMFPEGPVAMPDGSTLLVEIGRGTLTRVPAGGGTPEVVADLGGGPNGAAIGPDGACYVVNNGGFLWGEMNGMRVPFDLKTRGNEPPDFKGGWVNRVDLETGAHTVLYQECDGQTFLGPNDIVFDTDGGFWFTDFGKTRARSSDRGGLHYARADGSSVTGVAVGLNGPNGVGLSPEGDRVYVAESFTGRLLAWDVTGPGQGRTHRRRRSSRRRKATSTRSRSRPVATSSSPRSAAGSAWSRPTARATSTSRSPTRSPRTSASRGDDLRTAYVTLSGSGRLVSIDWPRPGLRLAY